MDDVGGAEGAIGDFTILCWLIVLLELDLLFWLGIIRGVEAVLS